MFGSNNSICSNYGFIAAGYSNRICDNHQYSAILGTYSKSSTASCTTYMCNVCAFGSLTKVSGTFKIDHPNPCKTSTHNLQHIFFESPNAGDNIYRFKIEIGDKLKGEITLPKYYKYLNTDSQVWVNPVDNLGRAFGVVNSKDTKVNITTSEPGNYNVLVISTRKDKDATQNWKGTETIKNEGELINYKKGQKNES
jgi:hypothetical protein